MIFRFSAWLLRILLSVGLGGVLVAAPGTDNDVIPAFDPSRYDVLWDRSPFGIDTAPMVVVEEGPSFAEDLAISGIVRSEGKESIVLVNLRTKEFTRATREEGTKYELLSLTVDRDRRKSWAMIGHQGETAELRFPEQKTSPVSKQALGAREVAGRNSREAGSRKEEGSASVAASKERASAKGGKGGPAARSSSGVSLGDRTAPSVSPPRRRVILPRQR